MSSVAEASAVNVTRCIIENPKNPQVRKVIRRIENALVSSASQFDTALTPQDLAELSSPGEYKALCASIAAVVNQKASVIAVADQILLPQGAGAILATLEAVNRSPKHARQGDPSKLPPTPYERGTILERCKLVFHEQKIRKTVLWRMATLIAPVPTRSLLTSEMNRVSKTQDKDNPPKVRKRLTQAKKELKAGKFMRLEDFARKHGLIRSEKNEMI